MEGRDAKDARRVVGDGRGLKRSGVALVVSLAAHAALVFVVLALPSARPAPLERSVQEVEIELAAPTVVPPEPERFEALSSTSEPVRPEPRAVARPAERRSQATGSVIAPGVETSATEASEEPVVQVPSVAERAPERAPLDARERERLGVLVDPRQAASSWVIAGESGPSRPSGPAGLGATGGRPSLATEADVERALGSHLRSEAMARPWLRRTEPQLVPRPDGSLEYRGHAFTARIAPDGSVTFSDRGAVQADEMLQGGPGRFDLTDLAMSARGQDPYAAEREWFMERTEAVRARLEAEARAREREAALRGIPGRLAAIWNRDQPAFVRRRAIFRVWDECSEEGDGLDVRRQVIEFVRTQIPRNSPDAFTAEELRRLNERRESTMPFEPY